MPLALPTIRSGYQAIYPVVRRTTYNTFVARFINGAEQRWPRRLPCEEFLITWKYISATDRAAIDTFFAAIKGGFENTWTFTLGAQTYTSLTTVQDVISWKEDRTYTGMYSGQLAARQTFTGGQIAAGVSLAAYPTFAAGNRVQYGWEQAQIARTAVSDLDSGPSYGFAFYGAGLTGFPTANLRSWILPYVNMPDADLTTLEAFFIGVLGRAGEFSFTSPYDSVVYPNVRFDMDALEITHQKFNQSDVTVTLIQTNN